MRNAKLEAYLKDDRQWKREHRIRFAKLMRRMALTKGTNDELAFWDEVLRHNGVVNGRVLASTSHLAEKIIVKSAA